MFSRIFIQFPLCYLQKTAGRHTIEQCVCFLLNWLPLKNVFSVNTTPVIPTLPTIGVPLEHPRVCGVAMTLKICVYIAVFLFQVPCTPKIFSGNTIAVEIFSAS